MFVGWLWWLTPSLPQYLQPTLSLTHSCRLKSARCFVLLLGLEPGAGEALNLCFKSLLLSCKNSPRAKTGQKNISPWVWFELVQPFSTCSRTMEQDSLSLLFFFFSNKANISPGQHTWQAALRPQPSLQLWHRVSAGHCSSFSAL